MKLFAVALSLSASLLLQPVAQAANDLERFFNQVTTFSARFDQVVLDESLNTLQESSGTMWIARPGKFRWDYDKPYEQHIIGDGKKVWSYDVELQQVMVRPMDGALGYTPAILMAGKGRLNENFTVTELGKQGSMNWLQMAPKKNDGGFETIRVGFENSHIRMLEMTDGFGQTTRLTLSSASENKKIKASKFNFKPPKGVDIVQQ